MRQPTHPLLVLLACALALSNCGREDGADRDPFDLAIEQVGYGAFGEATRHFAKAADDADRGSDRYIQALYGQAASAHQTAPPAARTINQAKKLYMRVIEEAPSSVFAARAMIGLGRIAEVVDYHKDTQDLYEARKWYREVTQRWPEHFLADEAAFRLASAYVQTYNEGDAREGVRILLDWLEDNPPEKNQLASAMWQYLGDTYRMPLNRYPDAVAAYVRADDIGLLERGREDPIWWKTAVLADRLWRRLSDDLPARLGGPGEVTPRSPDQPYLPPARYHGPVGIESFTPDARQKEAARRRYRDIARRYYEKMIVEAPKSGKGYDAQQRLIAMGYEPPPIPEFALAAQKAMEASRDAAQGKAAATIARRDRVDPAWLDVPAGFAGPDSPPPSAGPTR